VINKTCVIVGASHAGVSLALQLRREGLARKN
jgi:2-polyprenyl-6-methoxyphenol hydroxylase-like FAD-dependent oxidoreductase